MSMQSKKVNRLHSGAPCHYCRVPMTSPKPSDIRPLPTDATIEHLIPKSAGGSNDASNIAIACVRCNGLRGHLSYEIFEMFARVIVRKYPDTPTPILRIALRQFVDSLAEIAIRNNREAKRALSLALLSISEHVRKHT